MIAFLFQKLYYGRFSAFDIRFFNEEDEEDSLLMRARTHTHS